MVPAVGQYGLDLQRGQPCSLEAGGNAGPFCRRPVDQDLVPRCFGDVIPGVTEHVSECARGPDARLPPGDNFFDGLCPVVGGGGQIPVPARSAGRGRSQGPGPRLRWAESGIHPMERGSAMANITTRPVTKLGIVGAGSVGTSLAYAALIRDAEIGRAHV